MTLNRLTETPFNEKGIVYVVDNMETEIKDGKETRTKNTECAAYAEEGDATKDVIGTSEYQVLYADGYKEEGAKDSKKLYTKTLNVSERGELVRMNYYTVQYTKDGNLKTQSILNNSWVSHGEALDPSLLDDAFNVAELNTFLYNLTLVYDEEIADLNEALKADGVKREMSAEDKTAVIAEAKKDHPDLNMILQKMYDVSKLDKAVVDNLEWTILHYDYLAEGLRLAGADGVEHKDANGDVFKLNDDVLRYVKGSLFPTEPIFDAEAVKAADFSETNVKARMEDDTDPAGAKSYIAELAALDDINPLTNSDWNDPTKVRDYFNTILKAIVAAGGKADLPINLKGKDHAITAFTVGKTANGKSTYLSDQLNTEKDPQKEVKVNTGTEKVKGNFLVDKDGTPTGNEAETSSVRKIGKYLESIAAKYGIDLNDADDLAKLGDVKGSGADLVNDAVAAEAPAEPAPALTSTAEAAPATRVIITRIEPDGVEGFPDDVTKSAKKDADGDLVGKIYVKYVLENGKIIGLDVYKDNMTTPLALAGDADKAKAHHFESVQAYREYFGLNKEHTAKVEQVIAIQNFNAMYANANVSFEVGKSAITPEGKAELDKLIATIKAQKAYFADSEITIKTRGYSSFDKYADQNFTLANERGEAVSDYLEAGLKTDFPKMKFEPYVYDESLRAGATKKTSPIYYQADTNKRRTEISAATPEMAAAAATVPAVTAPPAPVAGKITYSSNISTSVVVKNTADKVSFDVPGIDSSKVEYVRAKSKDDMEQPTWAKQTISGNDPMKVTTTKFTGEGMFAKELKDKDSYTYSYTVKMKDGTFTKVSVTFKKP